MTPPIPTDTSSDLAAFEALLDEPTLGYTESLPAATGPSALDFLDSVTEGSEEPELIQVIDLDGAMDPRLKLLSHSSRDLLHRCPKKYQLYRLGSDEDEAPKSAAVQQAVTFAYGTAVGVGVQSVFEAKSLETCLLDTFLAWDCDLLWDDPKRKKSIWEALFATKKFYSLHTEQGYLAEYELFYYEGQPAIELAFKIILPDGFVYRGYVDAVLVHKVTGEIIILECKTSSGNASAAQYKNSGQALGYSVMLDHLVPDYSSYSVLYLVYETQTLDYVPLLFSKTLLQRAIWLSELLLDCETLNMYHESQIYPMYGHSCNDFFKPCEYLGTCTINAEHLQKKYTTAIETKIELKEAEYIHVFQFEDLISNQIARTEE